MKTVTQEDIRAIHSRLDVQRRIIASILSYSLNSMGFEQVMALLKMLEESQNPFEVSDDS